MDRVRQMHQGRLAIRQDDARKLKFKIKGLLESIPTYLDPLEKYEELEIDAALSQMTDLFAAWVKYKGILDEIAKAKKILGRE